MTITNADRKAAQEARMSNETEKKAKDEIDGMVLAAIKDGCNEAYLLTARFCDNPEFQAEQDRLSLDPWGERRPAYRVIDQSLQRLRRQEKIRYRKHAWEVVG